MEKKNWKLVQKIRKFKDEYIMMTKYIIMNITKPLNYNR